MVEMDLPGVSNTEPGLAIPPENGRSATPKRELFS
jgi:hypothetical protein